MAFPGGFGDEDLGTFFEDFEVVVLWPSKAITGSGILDVSTETHDFNSQRSEVMVGITSLLFRSDIFPGLKKNDQLIVDGIPHFVSQVDKEADGRTSRAHLRLV